MLKHISEIITETPQQKAQELNAAILQAVAAGHHILIETEQREYCTPKAYTFPQIKVRVYSPARLQENPTSKKERKHHGL